PSIQRGHVWKFDNHDPIKVPVAILEKPMTPLGQVTRAVLRKHRPDLAPVFLQFARIGHVMLCNQIGSHFSLQAWIICFWWCRGLAGGRPVLPTVRCKRTFYGSTTAKNLSFQFAKGRARQPAATRPNTRSGLPEPF